MAVEHDYIFALPKQYRVLDPRTHLPHEIDAIIGSSFTEEETEAQEKYLPMSPVVKLCPDELGFTVL
jgi:hypothetical protein